MSSVGSGSRSVGSGSQSGDSVKGCSSKGRNAVTVAANRELAAAVGVSEVAVNEAAASVESVGSS